MWCVLYVHLDVFKIQMFCIKQIDEFGRSSSERRFGRPFKRDLFLARPDVFWLFV